ncbi:MAG: J domain-containing protein [Flavobacteriales bacterium]|nr:J domain-containing protein [Flavobacteriales bacterium]
MGWAHDVLGVPPGADKTTIQRAFRRQVRDCHPDLHPQDPHAQERFIHLRAAYEYLMGASLLSAKTCPITSRFRSLSEKEKRFMRAQWIRKEKIRQRYLIICAYRIRLLHSSKLGWIKLMYVLSALGLVLLACFLIYVIISSFLFPPAEAAAVVVITVLWMLGPTYFLLLFLAHMRFVWDKP